MKQMNHIEALQYLCEKPEVNKVKDATGGILILDAIGEIRDQDFRIMSMSCYTPPFTAVEPEKSNEEHARHMYEVIWKTTQSHVVLYKYVFEIMDEKIKKAIK